MRSYENAWRSERLHYRALESPTHDAFIHMQSFNPNSYANSNMALLRPPSQQMSKTFLNWATAQLLAVVMCLPKDDPAVVKAQSSEKANGSNNNTTASAEAAEPSSAAASSASNVPGDLALEPIGMIFLVAPQPTFQHHRNSTIGVDIIAPYQRQGFGTEAIEWILHWGFRIAGLHKININCFSYNVGARKLYERLGFVVEGERRESVWFDGEWHGEVEMGMLEREWSARGKIKDKSNN